MEDFLCDNYQEKYKYLCEKCRTEAQKLVEKLTDDVIGFIKNADEGNCDLSDL